MIHAITCALVLTSGAGMSLVGPMISWICCDELAREALQLALRLSVAGIAGDAALGAAEGDVDHGGLPGHQRGERLASSTSTVGVVAQAALHGPAGVVVLDRGSP